ncbi:MAG: SufS family cysteine desulfurase [Fuerstiella sp.]
MFITPEEIFEEFESLDERDQSQYLLELGFDLPRFEDGEKRDEDLVHGCQSQVWMSAHVDAGEADPVIQFTADSDAEIVRGLITVLLASYNGKRASEVLEFSIVDVFKRLKIQKYISPQRQNGLQGMVDRIKDVALKHAVKSSHLLNSGDAEGQFAGSSEKTATAVEPFDIDEVRAQFPILNQTLDGGGRPIYLDSGASAQKPACVIEKEREVQETYFANAYRGRYSFGARVDDELEASRQTIAEFINAKSASEIAFTPGCTATLNMVAFGWGARHLQPGDEILTTRMEHHANLVPWQQVAAQRQAKLKFIPMTDDGQLDLEALPSVLTDRTKVVAVTAMSNVLGTVNPIAELAKAAHAVGAIIVVDGAQSVPHMRTDVVADDVDFLVFSGHKIYGPTGVGVLYGKAECLEETDPILFGGHMIDRVYDDHSTWAAAPAKFEAGTLPIVQAIALGTAVQWVQQYGVSAIHAHEQRLLELAISSLNQIDGLRIYGPDVSARGAIVSFRIDGVHPEDLAALLDRRNIFTRHGHHCTMPLHDLLQVSGTTRASFAAYNTEADVKAFTEAVADAVGQIRAGKAATSAG